MLQSKVRIKQRWTQYCSSLYEEKGCGEEMVKQLELITPPYNGNPNEILYAGVKEAIYKLKKNKSSGIDEITAEMPQAEGEQLAHKIHELCNRAWKEETIPEQWGKAILVPIPKKGDLSDAAKQTKIPNGSTSGRRASRIQKRSKHNTTNPDVQTPSGESKKKWQEVIQLLRRLPESIRYH
ncbi:unnamed protein product [Rotaria magnacalcarata]|uniref:Reverse transcriptase n=1 Tax=Rotaria magnacalcarata TaxID=392030 RepID=A0A816TUB8_9BILA|nr:unnamed protein product [Rotaria magnacalcarata]